MADVKISALTELTTPADTDELNIVDKSDTSFASTGTNKRIKVENLRGASAAQVTAIEANTAKVGITDAQADAIQQNTAKHGLYEFHANRVGRFRGVSGNPDTNTTIASGTAQFDGGDLYLSRTDVDGTNIGAALDAITGGTITIGGLTGTVSGNSANATRNAISVNWTNNVAPIANEGHIFSLFTGNANITEYGVYTDDTSLEKNGSQEEPLKVKARGINTDHLDTPTNGSVGQVIKRTQGANTMAWEDETTELPAVTTADNGDVLTVVAGAWNKAAAPAGSLPTVTSADNGEVLTVVGGAWAAAAAPSGGGTGTPLTRDVLATQSTFADTNAAKLNANIDLTSGKTLVGHDAFVVSFKYTHNINYNGHTFGTTNEFSKIYDGNVFRSFTGGKQPLEEVYQSDTSTGTVKFSIQRSTDTRVTVSFLSTDTVRANATITDFEITGIKYPVGGSGGTAGGLIVPIWHPTEAVNQGDLRSFGGLFYRARTAISALTPNVVATWNNNNSIGSAGNARISSGRLEYNPSPLTGTAPSGNSSTLHALEITGDSVKIYTVVVGPLVNFTNSSPADFITVGTTTETQSVSATPGGGGIYRLLTNVHNSPDHDNTNWEQVIPLASPTLADVWHPTAAYPLNSIVEFAGDFYQATSAVSAATPTVVATWNQGPNGSQGPGQCIYTNSSVGFLHGTALTGTAPTANTSTLHAMEITGSSTVSYRVIVGPIVDYQPSGSDNEFSIFSSGEMRRIFSELVATQFGGGGGTWRLLTNVNNSPDFDTTNWKRIVPVAPSTS